MEGAATRGFRDFAEGIGGVHEGRGVRQPFAYAVSDNGSTSSADCLATPDSSQKARTVHDHRSSDPNWAEAAEFLHHHQVRQYPPSEPSPSSYVRCKDCSRNKEELRGCRRELKNCRQESKQAQETAADEIQSLRTRLFNCHKDAKQYEEAEKMYQQIVKEKSPEELEEPAMLDLKHNFVDMLICQNRNEEAESISRTIWEKRKIAPDLEESKRSHRQLCSILVSAKKHSEAENMHRMMFHKEPKDSWALENGDGVCQTIAEQGQYEQAQIMQASVWEMRQNQYGPRAKLTIRSGLRRITFLEMLLQTNEGAGISDTEKRLSSRRKTFFEDQMEEMLKSLWGSRARSESDEDILDVGHKLGSILLHQGKAAESESMLSEVWDGRKRKFGNTNIATLSTGNTLGKALLCQRKYANAVNVCLGIWGARQSVLKPSHPETLSSGDDCAQAYFALKDWQQAEVVYKWVLGQRILVHDQRAPETINARWNLGRTLFNQGREKDRETEIHLDVVYRHWNQTAPNAESTLSCGQMLAELLQPQAEKANDALQVSRDVFRRREVSIKRDVDYLDSGRLYGWLLLENGDALEAEKVLQSLWEHEPRGTNEEKMRLKCGYLYGKVLFDREQIPQAKEVLEKVAVSQGALFPAEGPEVTETAQLLEKVSDRCMQMEKEKKQKNKTRRRGLLRG